MIDNIENINITSYEQYVELLNSLKKITKYIQIVQISGEDPKDKLIQSANKYMGLLDKKPVRKWLGTVKGGKSVPQYTYKSNSKFINHLKKYNSFFYNTKNKFGFDDVIETDFGQDDIAFLDENKEPLFYTTTHEGYANIRKDFPKKK